MLIPLGTFYLEEETCVFIVVIYVSITVDQREKHTNPNNLYDE